MGSLFEKVLHFRRHLQARPTELKGHEIDIPGTLPIEKAEVGKGVFPDKIVRLNPGESQKGYEIGKTLYVPMMHHNISVLYSPLRRAEDTAAYMLLGLKSKYPDPEFKVLEMRPDSALNEMTYLDSGGEPDDGNELVALAYNEGVNPHHPGYRLMIHLALQGDPRVEDARSISARTLRSLIPTTVKYGTTSMCLATSHQPNLELAAAELLGYSGKDEKNLVETIGGLFGVGEGFMLGIDIDPEEGKINEAYFQRSDKDFKVGVDIEIIKHYGDRFLRQLPPIE